MKFHRRNKIRPNDREYLLIEIENQNSRVFFFAIIIQIYTYISLSRFVEGYGN